MWLPEGPDVRAPDGLDVRVLLRLDGGSMAHFELSPGQTSIAVIHRRVEEIWFFLSYRHTSCSMELIGLVKGMKNGS